MKAKKSKFKLDKFLISGNRRHQSIYSSYSNYAIWDWPQKYLTKNMATIQQSAYKQVAKISPIQYSMKKAILHIF